MIPRSKNDLTEIAAYFMGECANRTLKHRQRGLPEANFGCAHLHHPRRLEDVLTRGGLKVNESIEFPAVK